MEEELSLGLLSVTNSSLHLDYFIQMRNANNLILLHTSSLSSTQDYQILLSIFFSTVVLLQLCYSNQKGQLATFCKIWDQISFTIFCSHVFRLTSSKTEIGHFNFGRQTCSRCGDTVVGNTMDCLVKFSF